MFAAARALLPDEVQDELLPDGVQDELLPDGVQDEPQALFPVAAAGVRLPAAQGESAEPPVAYSARRADLLRDGPRE